MAQSKKLPELHWSYIERKHKMSKENAIILWIFAITFAFVTFLFSNAISALVILSAAFAIFAVKYYRDTENHTDVKITMKGVVVNGLLFPYKSIKAFNIVEYEGDKYLILDIEKVLVPHLVLKINEDVNVEDVEFYISQFVQLDEKLEMPITHVLAETLGL